MGGKCDLVFKCFVYLEGIYPVVDITFDGFCFGLVTNLIDNFFGLDSEVLSGTMLSCMV